MFQTKVAEKIKTHILISITFFAKCAVYETVWKNSVELGRLQTTIWRTRISCWIHKATNKPSKYEMLIAFLHPNTEQG
jgi:hypothetical protein